MIQLDSIIRWNKQDSIRLEKAINHFNRELAKVENKENIPSRVKYNDLRNKIVTRRELDTIVKSLERATETNLEATEELASGEKISKWEYDDTIRRKNTASINLLNELDRINRERAESGNRYMGEERISEIQSTLDLLDSSLDDLESLRKNTNRLKNLGRTDLETYRNKIFMQNFYTALDGAKNFEHYKEFKTMLKQIRNPNKFYEVVKTSPILMDIFLWYKADDGALIYSVFDTNEEAFNHALREDFGMNIPED